MIKLADCIEVAKELNVEPEAILAVARVETTGDINAFLFEPHVFSRLTNHKYDKSHPKLSYPTWDRDKYPKSAMERQRQFDLACDLEPLKAYKAASWGLFQIMGYHYKELLYTSALSMSTDLKSGIEANVKAFGRMIKYMKLIEVLQDKNWEKFARTYNGSGFRLNHYDTKIAAEYNSIVSQARA